MAPASLVRRFAAAPAPARAAIYAVGSAFFFAGMSALIRHASTELHPFETVFFRNFFALLMMTPWLMGAGLRGMLTHRAGMHVFRAGLSLVSMLCGFTAVTLIPLTEATALSFTAPLFATAGAALILGEVVRVRRWTAIVIGFLGAMLVLRPGVGELSLGITLALANAVTSAGSHLVVKSLARTDRPEEIVTYMVLFLTPMSLIPALFVWQTPSWEMLGWLALLAGTGTLGHICFTRAFALADISVVLPFDFARLPFTALVAFIVFGEVATAWTWVGGAVIFASSVYIAHREARLARVARTKASADEPDL